MYRNDSFYGHQTGNYDGKFKKEYNESLYSQGRCPAICPYEDHSQCLLTAGHWGKHKDSLGHEWL